MIYDVIDYNGKVIRVIDESQEDYIYPFTDPNINNDKKGRFEIVKDFTDNSIFTKEMNK